MELINIEISDINYWYNLWFNEINKNEYVYFRGFTKRLFLDRYIENKFWNSYKIKKGNKLVGFIGYRIEEEEVGLSQKSKVIRFSDFIIDNEYRASGITKKIFEKLMVMEDISQAIFYPYNKNAYLSWKFLIKPDFIDTYNSWLIKLDLENVTKNEEYEFIVKKYSSLKEYDKWRYQDKDAMDFELYRNGDRVVKVIYNILDVDNMKIIDISDMILFVTEYDDELLIKCFEFMSSKYKNPIIHLDVHKDSFINKKIENLNVNKVYETRKILCKSYEEMENMPKCPEVLSKRFDMPRVMKLNNVLKIKKEITC